MEHALAHGEASGVVDGLTVVLAIGWLFGLGLFFLIAGRLSSPSLDRKGPLRFMRERACGWASRWSPTSCW